MLRRRVHSLLCLWAALSMVLASCRTPAQVVKPAGGGTVVTPPPLPIAPSVNGSRPTVAFDAATDKGAMQLVLSSSRPVAAGSTPTELSAQETTALLARMRPLPDLADANAIAPSMRPATPPPPPPGGVKPIAFAFATGKAVAGGFDPGKTPAPKAPPPKPLSPPSVTPSGEVQHENSIRIRFAEPMVPVAAVNSAPIPAITLKPAVVGTWRWVDTRLLQFTTRDGRFAGSTEFSVTVPAGLRAVSGAVLSEAVEQKFSTSPVSIQNLFPKGRVLRPDSPVVVAFDQAIDPAAILPLLSAGDGPGKQTYPIKVSTLADAEAAWSKLKQPVVLDKTQLATVLGRHHLVIAPVTAWPPGATVRIRLAEKAPSLEGPLRSTRVSTLDFDIARPFVVEGVQCGSMNRPAFANVTCTVGERARFEVTNRVWDPSYKDSMIRVLGQAPTDTKPQLYDSSIGVRVPDTANKTYTIQLDDGLVDVFGQPLTGKRQVSFRTKASPDGDRGGTGWLYATHTNMNVLDPRFEIPQWVLHASDVDSVRVQLFAVTPGDYFRYLKFQDDPRLAPLGAKKFDQTWQVGKDHGADLRVDLRPALSAAGTGHILAVATTKETAGRKVFTDRQVAWIQVTKMALSSRLDGEKVHTWAHDITPAKLFAPVPDVTTTLLVDGRPNAQRSAKSDSDGLTSLDFLPARPAPPDRVRYYEQGPRTLLVATSPTDSTFHEIDRTEKAIRHREALWYATDDRFTYKTGEPVYVKGWIRWTHDGVNPDLSLPNPAEPLKWTLTDRRGNRLANGTTKLTDQGGFDLQAKIPPNANLGRATFSFTYGNESHSLPISIEEFRTPAFAVVLNDDVTHQRSVPLYLGDVIEMSTEASYFSGGGLPGADIEWVATLRAASFEPPGWTDFTFTPPRARKADDPDRDDDTDPDTVEIRREMTGKLDARATGSTTIAISALPSRRPSILDVDATVVDVDRQRIRAGSAPIVVHPSSYYVGLTRRRDVAGADEKTGRKAIAALDVIVTDVAGKPVAGVPVTVEIVGKPYYTPQGKPVPPDDKHACTVTSGNAPVRCTYSYIRAYSYTSIASVTDPRGRPNRAQHQSYWSTDDSDDDLQIVPDKEVYLPGDVAKLDLKSKTLPAHAIVTFARRGVVRQQRVELKAASTIVELPIEPSFGQNIHVQVDRFRVGTVDVDSKVKQALPMHDDVVAIELQIDPDGSRLDVATKPMQEVIQPGAQASFEVTVTHRGKPKAGAEVALIVVDEAVLSVSGKRHPDPLDPFLQTVGADTDFTTSMDIIRDAGDEVLGKPGFDRYKLDGMVGRGSGTGSGYGVGGGRGGMRGTSAAAPTGGVAMIDPREDFRPNALFAPRLVTDAKGRATATVKMPDSLTKFRIVALATSETRLFGIGQNEIVTQRAVNARTVAPRFLSQGDRFEVPVVVQNLDRNSRTIDVVVRGGNLTSVGPQGKRVTVPAGQRAEVRFGFATVDHGRAVIQTLIASDQFADASNVEIPVYRPATTESFATYGIVQDDAPQFEQLAVPAEILPDVGGLEVELVSSQIASLTDAYWYLHAYPYECAEQRSSRMLANASMGPLVDAFAVRGKPSKQAIDAQRALDTKILTRDQQPDGGWGYFSRLKSDPMVSLQVLAALGAAKITGPVYDKAVAFATKHVDDSLSELEKIAAGTGATKSNDERKAMVALAATGLTALAYHAAFDGKSRALRLHAIAEKLATYPVDAKARVLTILAKHAPAQAVRKQLLGALLSATQETAASATVTTQFVEAERALLVSNTKTNALVLEALIREAPQQAVIAKLARGILDARRGGRWRTTQENMVVMQAMKRYFETYEKANPNFTGKLWVGNAAYTEKKFVGRERGRAQAATPWSALLGAGATSSAPSMLAFVKAGTGRMYYRVGITYAPKRADLPALDAGFVVRRAYTAVDDATDVQRLPDGRWKIKLGAKVQVVVETTAPTARYAVAIDDPLPAGLETVNTRLVTSERAVVDPGASRWDHVNMRDSRSEAFAMRMDAGVYRFSYTARATTPGTFIAAPAKATEMYTPETFGRSEGSIVVVE